MVRTRDTWSVLGKGLIGNGHTVYREDRRGRCDLDQVIAVAGIPVLEERDVRTVLLGREHRCPSRGVGRDLHAVGVDLMQVDVVLATVVVGRAHGVQRHTILSLRWTFQASKSATISMCSVHICPSVA